MTEERPYWNMEIEPLLNTPAMKDIQVKKLRKMLARMYANAPFYRRIMGEAGLDPEGVFSFEEFREKTPPFDKAALRQLVVECGGDILKALEQIMPVSVDDLDYMATTTGTTGIPTPYPLPTMTSGRFGARPWPGEAGERGFEGTTAFSTVLPSPWSSLASPPCWDARSWGRW